MSIKKAIIMMAENIIVNAFNVFTFNLILSLQKTLKITKTF